MSSKYMTTPPKTEGMPPGIPFIIGNEAAERFNFYGMRTILVVFMTQYLLGSDGMKNVMTDAQARTWFHTWVFAVYFLPFFGAILSDALLGKYRTIMSLSLVYCAGSVVLAIDQSRWGLALGLILIAVGSGGIKPCVSAYVGDQFGASNQHLLPRVFGWFYFSINSGSFFSTLLTPWLLQAYGPRIAFGIPAVFMLLATIIFWMGRHRFVHVPPAGGQFVRDTFSREGLTTIAKLIPIYVLVAVFWSLWDQTGSAWVLQAGQMDRKIFGFEILASQVQAANPILILILIPVFSYWIYPAINKVFKMSPLRKIGIGMFLTVPTFLICAWVETQIVAGHKPSIGWQLFDYVIMSAAEIMISITCLEFSYTQAPKRLKSLIMSLYLMSIALGNLFTSAFNFFIQNPDGSSRISPVNYYLFFSTFMLVTSFVFIVVAYFYKEKTHFQEDAPSPSAG